MFSRQNSTQNNARNRPAIRSADDSEDHDVIVIGAGPAGCATTLAFARQGARVLLLEANLDAANRLAGEWLHPGAVEVLSELGIDLHAQNKFESGRGFAVFPEDGSDAIQLPYVRDRRQSDDPSQRNPNCGSFASLKQGWSGEHRMLVDLLRAEASTYSGVTFLNDARVLSIEGQNVSYRRKSGGDARRATAAIIVGADGRSSRARNSLGLAPDTTTLSRMAGIRLSGIELPFEGYGHVLLGGPGPILAYRIGEDHVRLCIDLPSDYPTNAATLWDAYSSILPEALRPAFRRELLSGRILWAANQARPRTSYGRPGLCLIGDSVGFRHPLTAVGITLGVTDGTTLAKEPEFSRWQESRERDTRVAEMLGGVLYEVFSQDTDTTVAMRKGVYDLWRRDEDERIRTMRYLSGEPDQLRPFAKTFARITLPALTRLIAGAALARDRGRASSAVREIAERGTWLVRGAFRMAPSQSDSVRTSPETTASGLPRASMPRPTETHERISSASEAIESGVQRLVSYQNEISRRPGTMEERASERGAWEGEVAWCPMLAAQFVIFSQMIGREISDERRRGLLRHFEDTRFEDGLWGLHPLSEPYLFVTTLVYVASRSLGVDAESEFLLRAGDFIRREDVTKIPSWGKFWLALAGLYDWRGVPPIVPELWALPTRLPFHPSNFYCHTRHIYLSMSVLYARKLCAPDSRLRRELRAELFDGSYERIDWTNARRSLRSRELVTPPSLPLRLAYELGSLFERHHSSKLRRRVVADLEERIRWELRSSDHLSLSPVSGTLNILALWAGDANDPEIKRASERFEGWIWHDEESGTRIAGARSASWDSAFAIQALVAAKPHCAADDAIEQGRNFLRKQQNPSSPTGYREAFRGDPRGGWSFTNALHGWPVSDCTAEAVEALLSVEPDEPDTRDANRYREAVNFMLRCQNRDGGFGSYEAKRSRLGLEWLNPAEMFGDSMTEHTYVECTGSCIAALESVKRHFPEALNPETKKAVERAVHRLRALQNADGSWQGVWAVHFIYGTLFGIRGLVAAGIPSSDPALRRARQWILDHQRSDGGWGESHEGCLEGQYTENRQSQVIHTAWALLGLLEADEPDWPRIERGAGFLIASQSEDGSWPRQDPAGLFFRTALLDYELYRQIFPLWALSLYESRRKVRLAFEMKSSVPRPAAKAAHAVIANTTKASPTTMSDA
jgi:lanosterol synthase